MNTQHTKENQCSTMVLFFTSLIRRNKLNFVPNFANFFPLENVILKETLYLVLFQFKKNNFDFREEISFIQISR